MGNKIEKIYKYINCIQKTIRIRTRNCKHVKSSNEPLFFSCIYYMPQLLSPICFTNFDLELLKNLEKEVKRTRFSFGV